MWNRAPQLAVRRLLPAVCLGAVACGQSTDGPATEPSGGTASGATGGETGGVAETTGGAGTAGVGGAGATDPVGGGGTTGGAAPTGGVAATGGSSLTGGVETGGAATGGTGVGGSDTGGTDTGGAATGGTVPTGGAPTEGPCSPGVDYPVPDLSVTATAVHSATGSGLFEGVLWLERGELLFSDMSFTADVPPSTIQALVPPSSVQTFLADAGTNGLALAPDGTVLGCAHDVQGIVRIDPDSRERTIWVDAYQGNSFNSPNDIAVRSDGTTYFSDPDWQLGSRVSETGMTGVYRVSPDATVSLVDGSLTNPNGVALSPDQTSLYVGEEPGTIWRYAVTADGDVEDREAFASGIDFPDGMGIDCAGNLYVADHQVGVVRVYAADGTSLGSIDVAPSVTNLAFGGDDRTTLYVSAGKTIYSVPMNLPGYPY